MYINKYYVGKPECKSKPVVEVERSLEGCPGAGSNGQWAKTGKGQGPPLFPPHPTQGRK